jgi:hypothetical protein
MKKITVLLFIFIFAGIALSQVSEKSKNRINFIPRPAEIQLTETTDSDGKTSTYIVSTTDLYKSPEWNGTGEPPLSIATAVSLAETWLKTQNPEFKNFRVNTIMLTRVGEWSIKNRWYYDISLEAYSAIKSGEIHSTLQTIMLLNGKFIEPKIKQE